MWNAVYSVKNVHLNKHKKTGQKTSSKETKWSEKVIKAQKTSRALLLLTKNLTAKKKTFKDKQKWLKHGNEKTERQKVK